MRTPSIERRFVAVGVCVVVVLVLALDVLLYFSVRSAVIADANETLDANAAVVRAEATLLPPRLLAKRLDQIGMEAVVIGPDGEQFPTSPYVAASPDTERTSREIAVEGGARVVVSVRAAEGDNRLKRLLVVEAIATPLVVIVAAGILRWIAEIATQPLAEITARARRTARGRRGERLEPDQPETRLGQMATAYDAMLDSLEGAVAEASAARAESERLERRTHKILETAHDAFIVLDEDGAVIDWNPEAERMFGWPREEVLGRSWQETLLPPDMWDAPEADDGAPGADGGLPPGLRVGETVAVRRDGVRFPIGVTAWATEHDGGRTFNAFVRDLTERRRADEATSHLAAIVESSDRAMISTDPTGIVISWNPAAERMYGYSAAEAVGKHLPALIVPEDQRPKFDQALATVARGDVIQRDEVIRRRKDGSRFHVSLTIAPLLDPNGAIYGACSVARDMTDEREMASQLDASLIALAAAAEEARESEARTRRFLDDAAHQLRSPITSIRACTETLSRDVTPAQRERLLEAVCRESERASRLMAGLLRMARLGHEQERKVETTDVVALCEGAAETARLDSPHLDVSVDVVGPQLGPLNLAGDALAEILSNLVDNARRHARARIVISVAASERGVELRVVDDGPGLPPDQTEAAFARFVSLDNRGGSGLGLAIGRELARARGGDLTYEDGAFVLRLPASVDPAAGDGDEVRDEVASSSRPLR